MYTNLVVHQICAFVLVACCFLCAAAIIPPVPPQMSEPAQPQSTNPNAAATPNGRPQPPTTSPAADTKQQARALRKILQSPKQQAWQMLTSACAGSKANDRAIAIRVLGFMPNDAEAVRLAEKALKDDKPEVRSAAAAALGDMKSRRSISKLKKVLDDKDPSVALATAHALYLMHDNSAYEVYYEVLNGERKSGKGLMASQASILHDPKKLAELGFEQGIGFIPFAGIGWGAIKEIRKDDSSPIRAAAAKVLAKDPDPATTKVLVDATGDKSWLVRAAALEALASRGDPSVLDTVKLYMSDEKDVVKYAAAATVLRLTAIKEAGNNKKSKKAE